jgi:hypothetical protein
MEQSVKEKVLNSIEILKNKTSRIYFLVQDTKGNARASIRYIYQMALSLKNAGFNPIILHEKNDYYGVKEWLGEVYMTDLPHRSLEGQNLEISPEDFIVIPEIFGYVMEQIKNIPCGKIVLCQSYSYIVETLQPGESWNQLGFLKCITTSEKQRTYLESVMRNVSYDIIPPVISDEFQEKKLPSLPIIAVHTREQSDTVNLIKTFYLKFPQFRWFTFKDMRGLSETEFANALKECCLSVWVDDKSAFGTFPLESMASGVPVLGKIPDIQPEWISQDNGMWINETVLLPDFVADFMQNWLEDNIDQKLYKEGMETAEKYKNKSEFDSKCQDLFEGYVKLRLDSFQSQLEKTEI